MGEWSEYFEDFPEENPANYINGRFAPEEARQRAEQSYRVQQQREAANAEINDLIRQAKSDSKRQSFVELEPCVQCGETKLSIYKYRDDYFSCECESCGIYGDGIHKAAAIASAESRIGEFIDWREKKGF
ncbi:hypothetical protein [Endozoicomonas atrinae]|uniref:hypothetical protein n=1 Tax=Endozoicomonas atrinae TaxID=1333660 RepID=UPI003B00E471